MNVICWVDANFCGLYGTEDVHDSTSVKSHTGYIITVANCPAIWVSKLQTESALSTVDSEFTALSQSVHSLIPLRCIMEEISTSSFCLTSSDPISSTAKSTVFEDNTGALTLAKTKKMTAHTWHIAVKYFWFLNKIHLHVGRFTLRKSTARSTLLTILPRTCRNKHFNLCAKSSVVGRDLG